MCGRIDYAKLFISSVQIQLLTYSSVGIAAVPPTSSAKAIHHRVFRPLESVHSQDGGSTVMISHCASVVGFQLMVFPAG